MLESYQRPTPDGWRCSLGWRTRKQSRHEAFYRHAPWIVQRWNGERWVTIDFVESYARAREVPEEWRRRRAV
jgi:hypothetical protein